MDKYKKYIEEYEKGQTIEDQIIGLNDTFPFHCTQCGKCCINRQDILLTPYDIYRMSHALGMHPKEFAAKYCEVYLGDVSQMVIVRLRPRGTIKRCPLLQENKCMVHEAKPAVCAMFPIGRCVGGQKRPDGTMPEFKQEDVRYIFTGTVCGGGKDTHVVREWLTQFGISLEDEIYLKWQNTIAKTSALIGKMLHMNPSEHVINALPSMVYYTLYLHYDTEKTFLPQLEENVRATLDLLQSSYPLKNKAGDTA